MFLCIVYCLIMIILFCHQQHLAFIPRTGVKDSLVKSGAYPIDFGVRVAELHLGMLVARMQLQL